MDFHGLHATENPTKTSKSQLHTRTHIHSFHQKHHINFLSENFDGTFFRFGKEALHINGLGIGRIKRFDLKSDGISGLFKTLNS